MEAATSGYIVKCKVGSQQFEVFLPMLCTAEISLPSTVVVRHIRFNLQYKCVFYLSVHFSRWGKS